MSRINRVPWGLQDILGSQSQGENPSELLQEVRPSFDMWPLWAQERIQYDRITGSITARGQNVNIAVPDGEYWMPIAMYGGVAGFADIGTVIKIALFGLRVSPNTGNFFVFHESDLVTSTVVGELFHTTFPCESRVLYPPGTVFGSRTSEYVPTIGPDTLEFGILYWQLAA